MALRRRDALTQDVPVVADIAPETGGIGRAAAGPFGGVATRSARCGSVQVLTPSSEVPEPAKGLCKSFRNVLGLQDVSLTVQDRQFVTIVGPSGCGKSTLLRLISGLIPPTSGEVLVRGTPVSAPIIGVGMVFQSPVLMPWRTTLDNIFFVAEMRGEAGGKYHDRALELIELAGLTGFEQKRPHELSGGMQQRVAICRALLLSPPLILMDEPFGALDVITRERMGFELEKIWNVTKTTVIFVTHSISEIRCSCPTASL